MSELSVSWDQKNNLIYVQLHHRHVDRTVEFNSHVLLDLDDNGELIGIEILA